MSDERNAVAAFLKKCNTYAQASIQRKQERGDLEDIPKWKAYIEFNEHALEELANGTLDRWFTDDGSADQQPLHRLPVNQMQHVERSIWLNNVLSPRPVVVAGTLDEEGQRNLAPLSSVMQVSTRPPYLTASFSIHKDGRPRDTLANLRSTGRIVLNMMPATPRGAEIVDETATPLPKGSDEGQLIDLETVKGETLLLAEAVAAIEATYVEEHALPDAVAVVAVLKVEAVWFSGPTAPAGGLEVLCQHGRDDMTPAPQGWTRRVEKHYGQG
jgi:flavin reductase (DIM6/NTAB) family NADH-FMN oxidoreductase RutF